MHTYKLSSEKGQSLVLVCLGFLAFVAILALVLDGGNAYATKRQAQNAADAGALAGATYMCQNHDEAGGINTARVYAISNGAVDPPEVYASLSSGRVMVTATVTKNTFFAGVIGIPHVSTRAVAEAACRPPIGMGVLPVAWACRSTVVGGMNVPGEDCAQIKVEDCDGDPYDLDCTYVLMDAVKVSDSKKGGHCDPDVTDPTDPKYCYTQNDLVCSAHGPDINPSLGCNYVAPNTTDCDLNNDCVDELMTGGGRSWLDLNGSGGGASDLKGWIGGSKIAPPIPPHKWIPSENGVTTSVFQTVANLQVGNEVILPVFNNICDGVPNIYVNPETLAQCTYGPDDDLSIARGYTNYHIMTFSLFHVTCVQTGKNKVTAEPGYIFDNAKHYCNGHQAAKSNGSIDDNDKTIEGYFLEDNLGGYSGPGDWFDTGTFTVVLVR